MHRGVHHRERFQYSGRFSHVGINGQSRAGQRSGRAGRQSGRAATRPGSACGGGAGQIRQSSATWVRQGRIAAMEAR